MVYLLYQVYQKRNKTENSSRDKLEMNYMQNFQKINRESAEGNYTVNLMVPQHGTTVLPMKFHKSVQHLL